MFSKLEFKIASKYLKAKQREGFISIIAIFSFVGITIGVATLIIVMSVMNGFRYELVNRILGINSHLTIYSREGKISNYEEIIKALDGISEIKNINPLVESQAMVSANGKAVGSLVRGINLDDLKKKNLISQNIIEGNLDNLKKRNNIIVGSGLARTLHLDIGDPIKIISSETNSTILGSIPRMKTYKLAGVFESGMYEYDATTIFLPLQTAQIHFRYKNSASAIEIFGFDTNQTDYLSQKISQIINNQFPELYLRDWQQANASFIDALKVERTVMFLILTLIIIVAAFNIVSSLIMLVGDKKKNVACLRTMGISKSSIMRIFLICGLSIGFAGTICGLTIGVVFSANINSIKHFLEGLADTTLFNPAIYFLSQLPSKIFISDVAIIVLMALALSFLATIYPAYKASKANPADILRY